MKNILFNNLAEEALILPNFKGKKNYLFMYYLTFIVFKYVAIVWWVT